MSRAFTKEDDAGDDLVERPIPPGPNYVTRRGFDFLKNEAIRLVAQRKETAAAGGDLKPIDRDLRYLEARISGAIIVPKGKGGADAEARFGARVTIEDETGRSKTFQIVGEDEARTDDDKFLAWSAPLVQAMLGAKAGDKISWQGLEGVTQYRIVKVEY